MSIKINYKNIISTKSTINLVLFVDENFNIKDIKKYISNSEFSYIADLLKNSDLKKDTLFFEVNSKKTIFLVSVKKNIKISDIENLGAKFHSYINFDKKDDYFINSDTVNDKTKNFIGHFLHGLKLKSYEFNIYKSKINKKIVSINVIGKKNKISTKDHLRFKALEEGSFFARDLVSEPGNVLHPDEYAKRINTLKKFGLKINIYDEKKLKKLGMNALLGVGQGSIRGSYLVTMEWNGAKNNSNPLAFVGKGVCFDTGGYSLKPAKFMEDMTYDMAGSATVVGLMKNLAIRKAKINAVGVVGLVENMVSGNAQRPGDIVKSYSGKTIEVLNTDAEGRLVLADALTFTEKKFKPKFMVDLATLTGAIIVSLGSEYAGLFSNDDKLSKQLLEAGDKVEEKLWRMPLHKNFDKLIDSKNADMQNINYVGGAGSTTAAQFLQRFILNKTPWAHLDIAGMAFSKYGGALNSGGATSYGVRLLNQLIEDNYE
ncbi:leucyl aminopeptidase [Candidatus Pelagibacter bacterium]|nr:leucyl aminopeptidase [Candidatus Pelagibacter bacterium]MDA8831473.1 leucyl aminopeptidase [Candidatus Pelagibacter bacterium]MDB9714727.1 leucyl aminopeptidase [Candidatus Pelagibacter ubique]MDC0569213.1 leucyl aminopeptidase [bacterium]